MTKLIDSDLTGNDIIFWVNNEKDEMLRLCSNGEILVKGKLAATDLAVYEGFVEFLKVTGHYKRDELQ